MRQLPEATSSILLLISAGLPQGKIADKLGLNRGAFSRRVSRLQKRGLVGEGNRTAGGRFLSLTGPGRECLKELLTVAREATSTIQPMAFRHHYFTAVFRFKSLPLDWERRLLAGGFVASARHNYSGFQSREEDATIFFNSKSCRIDVRAVRAQGLGEALQKMISLTIFLKGKLEDRFPGLKLLGDFQVVRQHLAMEGGLSDWIPDGYKYASDRLVVDASTGRLELEAVKAGWAVEDMGSIMAWNEALVAGRVSEERIRELEQAVSALATVLANKGGR